MPPTLLARLDARDRALFTRLALTARPAHTRQGVWCAVTHLGGARGSIGLCLLSMLVPQVTLALAGRALLSLALSHMAVHIIKRFVGRERPTARGGASALINIPDEFSFPSGHACAAMSIAATYGWAFPSLALPLLMLALLVGLSRVVLGVHYPGDVVVGQAIAAVTTFAVLATG